MAIDRNALKGKLILVVEDDSDLREVLVETVRIYGAKVHEASDAQSALSALDHYKFDCILSDVRMPGGDGVFLLSKVKEKSSNPPAFIFVSGFADFTPDQALAAGAQAMIAKPFDHQGLVNVILTHCR